MRFALLIIGSGLFGCGNYKTTDPDFKYERIQTAQSTDTGKELSQITLPGINTADKNPTTILPVSATSNSNTADKNLNPAHGLPGHRCELAVGAPLNNTPVTPPQPVQIVQQPQPAVVSKSPEVFNPKTTTGAGINPAHGQPGHRCEIAVGAPLNSATVTAPQQTQQVVKNQVSPTTKTAPGMNPQHGKPGHRCDIAVGAPLSQAIVKKDDAGQAPKIILPSIKDSTKN